MSLMEFLYHIPEEKCFKDQISEEHFSGFQQRYGFDNIFAGLNYVYSKPERI